MVVNGKLQLEALLCKAENGLEAAIRELKEETGLNAGKMKEITRVVHDGHHSLYIILFMCV